MAKINRNRAKMFLAVGSFFFVLSLIALVLVWGNNTSTFLDGFAVLLATAYIIAGIVLWKRGP